MLYQYRAANVQGRVHSGQIEALHELDLEVQLKHLDLLLLRAKPLCERHRHVRHMARRDLISFLFQLELLVRAGVPILAALVDLRDSSEAGSLRELAAGLYEKIQSGATLGEAVAAYPGVFAEAVVNLIHAGEVTGQIAGVLQEIVRSLKWQDELAAQTRKLLLYPSFVLLVVSAVVFFLMIYLVPQLVGFLVNMGQEIPLQTRLLIGASNLFVSYGWALLLTPPLLALGLGALATGVPGVRYRLHQAELAIPYLGPILKKMALARFADTLALMYRTGVPLVDGLKYCQNVSPNRVLQHAIARARERVVNGGTLSDSFAAEGLFPALVIRMLRVGESTGALDAALSNISYFYSRDIDASVGKLQALLEPALTIMLGLILGWIMLAVLGPIYDSISRMKI